MQVSQRPGAIPGMFAYAGSSMSPTLNELDLLEVRPCEGQQVRAGDVILFASPESERLVVHRVVRTRGSEVLTRGDSNMLVDPWVVCIGDVKGRVIAAWRGERRRTVLGGRAGRLQSRLCRIVRRLLRVVESPRLVAVTRAMSARLLPARLRPRVLQFSSRGQGQACVVMGRRVVARYDHARRQWQAARLVRTILDPDSLPIPAGN
jgi:hypothetical protein